MGLGKAGKELQHLIRQLGPAALPPTVRFASRHSSLVSSCHNCRFVGISSTAGAWSLGWRSGEAVLDVAHQLMLLLPRHRRLLKELTTVFHPSCQFSTSLGGAIMCRLAVELHRA